MNIDETKLITITSKDTLDNIIDTLERLQRDLNRDLNSSTHNVELPLIFDNINVAHKEDVKSGSKIKLVCTTNYSYSACINTFDNVNAAIEGILRNYNFIRHTHSIDNYGYEMIRFIPTKDSEFKDYFVTVSIYNSMYGISISYKHEHVWFVDDLSKKSNMTFKEAYDWMLLGYYITRPCFNGVYWYINTNSEIIKNDNGETCNEENISTTMNNIFTDDWMILE